MTSFCFKYASISLREILQKGSTSDESNKNDLIKIYPSDFYVYILCMYVVTISPPDTLVSTQTEERCEEPAEGDADPTSTPRLIREQGTLQGGVFCGDLMLFMRS